MAGNCSFGKNGCVPVQDILTGIGKMQTLQNTHEEQIQALFTSHDRIQGLMVKFIIAIAVLTVIINSVFQAIPEKKIDHIKDVTGSVSLKYVK